MSNYVKFKNKIKFKKKADKKKNKIHNVNWNE